MPLTTFEQSLVLNARKVRDERLANGEPCCGNCKHSRPPDTPEHASHYVYCGWLDQFPELPEWLRVPKSTPLCTIGHNGWRCGTYEKKED